MEQQEKSEQPTATRPSVETIARNNFFQQPDMVRFLLSENLALKSLLYEKGMLTPEEFKTHRDKADAMLESKVDTYIAQWKKDNPKMVAMLELDARLTDPNDPYSVF